MDINPSPLSAAKTKRYDRQLRLWGDHGQSALENSSICLVNATGYGTEILKNLILPGIGRYCIIDNNIVGIEDLGCNFFLTDDCIGKNRGKCCVKLLNELNPEVVGEHIEDSLSTILENNLQYMCNFHSVVACGLPNDQVMVLADFLWRHNISLFVVHCSGLIGYVRLAVHEHCVIESHPDNTLPDLRLTKPFETLKQYSDSFNLSTMTSKQLGHVPFVILLLKALDIWLIDNAFPRTRQDKEEFRKVLNKLKYANKLSDVEEENEHIRENFEEASSALNTAFLNTDIPSSLTEIFNDPLVSNIDENTADFWLMVRALHTFTLENNCLPLRGSLPDMFSSSEAYIHLQNLYQTEAKRHEEQLREILNNLFSKYQPARIHGVPSLQLSKFCRNVGFLSVTRCRSLHDEWAHPDKDLLRRELLDPNSLSYWYLMIRASVIFGRENRRYPNHEDAASLRLCVGRFISDLGITPEVEVVLDDFVQEWCRYAHSDIHSVSSFVGGVVAQEVIKVLTRQFIPMKNTLIYSAISGNVSSFDF